MMELGTKPTFSDSELLHAQKYYVIICLQKFTLPCSPYHASSFFHSIISLADSVSAEKKIFLNYSNTFQIANWGNSFKNILTFCEIEKTPRNVFHYQKVSWKIMSDTHCVTLNYSLSFPKANGIINFMPHKSYTTLPHGIKLTFTWHF